jgi:hypothetical protein
MVKDWSMNLPPVLEDVDIRDLWSSEPVKA